MGRVSLLFIFAFLVSLINATGVSIAVFGDAVAGGILTIQWTGYPPFTLEIQTATVQAPAFVVHKRYEWLQVTQAVWNVDVASGTLIQLVLYDAYGDWIDYDFLVDYNTVELPLVSQSSMASVSAISVASTQAQVYTSKAWTPTPWNPTVATTSTAQSIDGSSSQVLVSVISSASITGVQSSVTAASSFTTSGTFIIPLPLTTGSASVPTTSRISTTLAAGAVSIISTTQTSSTAVLTIPDTTGTSLSSADGGSSTSNTAAIVGGVLGGLLALILLIFCCSICIRRRRREARRAETYEEGSQHDHDGLGLLTGAGIGAGFASWFKGKKRHSGSSDGHLHGGALGLAEKRRSHSRSSSSSSSSSGSHNHTARNVGLAAGAATLVGGAWSKLTGAFGGRRKSSSSSLILKTNSPKRHPETVNWNPDEPHMTPTINPYHGADSLSGHGHGVAGVGVGGSQSSHSHHTHTHNSQNHHHHLGVGLHHHTSDSSHPKHKFNGGLNAAGRGGHTDVGYVVDEKWPHRSEDATNIGGQSRNHNHGIGAGAAVGIGAAAGVGAALAAGSKKKRSGSQTHAHTHQSHQHAHHSYGNGHSQQNHNGQAYLHQGIASGSNSGHGHELPGYEGAAYGDVGYGYGYGNGARDEKQVLKERDERNIQVSTKVKKHERHHEHKEHEGGSPFADEHSVSKSKSSSSSSSSSSNSSTSSSDSDSGSSSSSSSSSSDDEDHKDGMKDKLKKKVKGHSKDGHERKHKDRDHDHQAGKKSGGNSGLAYPDPVVTYNAVIHYDFNHGASPYEMSPFNPHLSQKSTPTRPPRPDVDLGLLPGPGGMMVKPTVPGSLAVSNGKRGSVDPASRGIGFGKHRRTSSSLSQSISSPLNNPAAMVGHTRKISNPMPFQPQIKPQMQQPGPQEYFSQPSLPSWALREDSRYPDPRVQLQPASTQSSFSDAQNPGVNGFSNYGARQLYPLPPPPQHPSRLSIVPERSSAGSSPSSSTRWFQRKPSADVPSSPTSPSSATFPKPASSTSSSPQISTMTHSESTHATTVSTESNDALPMGESAYASIAKPSFESKNGPRRPDQDMPHEFSRDHPGFMMDHSDAMLRRELDGARNGSTNSQTPLSASFPHTNFNSHAPLASVHDHRQAVESWGMAPSMHHNHDSGPAGASGGGSTSLNNRHLSNVTANSGRVLSDISSRDSEWMELQRQLKWADDHESHIMPTDFTLKDSRKGEDGKKRQDDAGRR